MKTKLLILLSLVLLSCTKEDITQLDNDVLIEQLQEVVENEVEENVDEESSEPEKPAKQIIYTSSFENHESNDEYFFSELTYLEGNPHVAVGMIYIHLNDDDLYDLVVKDERDNGNLKFYIKNQDNSYTLLENPIINYDLSTFGARKLVTVDFNNDGLMDILMGLAPDDTTSDRGVAILQHLPDHTFQFIDFKTGHWAHHISAADINNDGFVDIIGAHKNAVYLGNGDFTFKEERLTDNVLKPDFSSVGGMLLKGTSSEMVDINNDGFVDLIIGLHQNRADHKGSEYSNSHIIHFGTGDNTLFGPPYILESIDDQTNITLDFTVFDFDNDGDLDLFVNSFYEYENHNRVVQYYQNNGDNTFSNKTKDVFENNSNFVSYLGYRGSDWIKAMDYTKDGRMELMIEVENKKQNEYGEVLSSTDFNGWKLNSNGKLERFYFN